jgi:hypothetical protein
MGAAKPAKPGRSAPREGERMSKSKQKLSPPSVPGATSRPARRRTQRGTIVTPPDIPANDLSDPQTHERVRDSALRKLHTFWRFWVVCPDKACGRAHSCRGDVTACGRRCYRHVPADTKFYLKKAIEARLAGLSVRDACREAQRQLDRCKAIGDAVAQCQADATAAAPARRPQGQARISQL